MRLNQLKTILLASTLSLVTLTTYSASIDLPSVYEPHSTLEVSLLNGVMTGARTGTIVTPFGNSIQGNQVLNNFETGAQVKLFFTPLTELRTYLYTNVLGVFRTANQMLSQPTFPFFGNSIIELKTNYIARLGVGFETDSFHNFSASIGVGLAEINQQLYTKVTELNAFSSHITKNSVLPTISVALNYKVCPACINEHPLLLGLQYTADEYPTLGDRVVGVLGTYQSTVRAAWNYHWDFVIGTRF